MFSRARIFGHPIHPMIIPLPIGSFVLGLLSLIVFAFTADFFWLQASYWLSIAGVVGGLLAAVAGLVDWATIPRDVAAKPIATWHGVLNGSIVVLFFVSWLLLGGFTGPVAGNVTPPLILQALGVIWLGVSGWLGWEMVYRHHVGVEPVSNQERRIVEEEEHRRAA
ncbi:MAG: DUF2231 domain-containing protein [Sphingomonadaceae bacterium]